MTLTHAVDIFLLDQQLRGNTDKTINGYRGFLGRFVAWLATKNISTMPTLTLQHIQSYQIYLSTKQAERSGGDKLTRRTIQTYVRHIKCFLAFCYTEGFLHDPIHTRVKLPKAEKPVIEILTDEEVGEILDCFPKTTTGARNTAIVLLMLDCGLRLSEVTTLKTSDINMQKGYLTVMGKGRKARIVPVGLKVRRALMGYLHKRFTTGLPADNEFIFLTRHRKPMTIACIASLMARLKKDANIPRLHAHLFRHTYATNFLVHGLGDIYELSRLLGHSDLKVTTAYLQLASYYTIIEKRRHVSYLDMKR